MAGMSSRFTKAGYSQPKYMLDLHGSPLFDYCVSSFKAYFKTEVFLFISRSISGSEDFIHKRCSVLGIERYEIIILDSPTQGQAETVALGLMKSTATDDNGVTVFNIDTIRANYEHPDAVINSSDGFIEVFSGDGDNWSFAELDGKDSSLVLKTAEKEPISEWCSTGLYYFSSKAMYLDLFKQYSQEAASNCGGGEYYIAPMYNLLIEVGKIVRANIILAEDVIFSGVPSEYELLKSQSISL